MEPKKRLVYPDILKICAIFGVILIHTTANMLGMCPVGNGKWQIVNVISGLVRWSVPVFFMASGIFFLDPNKEIGTGRIFRKYIPRLVVALIFWGVAYELYYVAVDWVKTGAFPSALLWEGIKKVATGKSHFHLYFLYLIIGLYLVTPVLRVFTKHGTRRQIEYFLLLFFLFSGLFPLLIQFPPFSKFAALVTQMRMNVVAGYVGYFVAGYYFHTYPLKPRTTRVFYALGILGGAVTVVGTMLLSIHQGKLATAFYEGLAPNVMLMSFALFLFVKNRRCCRELSGRAAGRIGWLAGCIFGVYLIHDFFNMMLNSLHIHLIDYAPLAVIPAYTVLVFGLSLLITAVIRKIPILNKYII